MLINSDKADLIIAMWMSLIVVGTSLVFEGLIIRYMEMIKEKKIFEAFCGDFAYLTFIIAGV